VSKFTAACLAFAVTLVMLAALADRERQRDEIRVIELQIVATRARIADVLAETADVQVRIDEKRAEIEKLLMPPPPQTQSVVPVPGQCKGFHAAPMVVSVPFATGPDLP